ncbi:hypothetical protein RF11_14118 [Thelohanellus kitauei]|uniref:Uncharacterized protein n=1 Tax=Thelohanellus kitauei TaxID=669202 RepID=A0A0C2MBY6_THEKT|nr:hypothetical protein RF11_14118 [Thelohanellus kitauei]
MRVKNNKNNYFLVSANIVYPYRFIKNPSRCEKYVENIYTEKMYPILCKFYPELISIAQNEINGLTTGSAGHDNISVGNKQPALQISKLPMKIIRCLLPSDNSEWLVTEKFCFVAPLAGLFDDIKEKAHTVLIIDP